ncbi:thiamine pyrophosphate enzyme, N-terminal TPP binding domain-containing protein [Lyophyllum atratum]|nr:thiamine pyrophosphate enzyme, N-terminal TPP binding domain-containing protein [Lyophyllum atratum]
MYTTSSVFLKSLADAGITHAFVNWGSDHPALLEDLEQQRIEANGRTKPEIVTCPNEMVALSAAQGYAQVTGKPAAVIVHVDVGTQAMAGAIHNVDRSRTPVLIYAGASPFSSEKELKGTRNEWIMWLQDIPDQAAIVRQYMRFTSQISSGSTASQFIRRSLQIATSDPKGPVYLWARREVMEEEIPESLSEATADLEKWPSIEPSGLSSTASTRIGSALLSARSPLIITSFLGRNPHAVSALLALSTLLAIPIVAACPNAVNIPFSHPYFAGVSFLAPGTHSEHLASADTILVIDCDLPWIPGNDRPSAGARVFVVDSGDPLKHSVGFWHVAAELVCRADAELALVEIVEAVRKIDEQGANVGEPMLRTQEVKDRGKLLAIKHEEMVRELDEAENAYPVCDAGGEQPVAHLTVPNILGVLRRAIAEHTPSHGGESLVLNESISNFPKVWQHLRPEVPGSVLSSGGSSLGWALGAAVGAHIGGEVTGAEHRKGYDLITAVVGDGSFMFGVPSSAYWMARKYNTPFLTIILNNGGWKSPKLSMLGVHPSGHGSKASGDKLSVGFGPDCPDYSQIAVAASAGWAWGKRVGATKDVGKGTLEQVIAEAVNVVVKERRCAVVDCVIESI